MIVKGKSTSEHIIEGRFTTSELEALIRASLAIPKDASFRFYHDGPERAALDDDNPLRFTISWRTSPDFNQEQPVPVVIGAPRSPFEQGSPMRDATQPKS